MREKIKVKFQIFPKKESIDDNGFRIFKCSPIDSNSKIKVDDNFMFSIKGELPYLNLGMEYDVDLEETETNKWGTTYKVLEVFDFTNFKDLTRQQSEDILVGVASKNNTKTLLDNYPNFIELVLTDGIDAIDTSKLYNIKEAKMNSYQRVLCSRYKYVNIINKLKDYEITISEAKILSEEFKTIENIEKQIQDNPYYVLIDVLNRPFISTRYDNSLYGVDITLVNSKTPVRPDLKASDVRCEYMMIHTLELNENGDGQFFKGGSTRLNGKKVYEYCKSYAPELCAKMKNVAIKCDGIYIDEQTNDMSKMSTYLKEVAIAEFVTQKLKNPIKYNIDWKSYKTGDDYEMTDEQCEIIRILNEYNIGFLIGSGGTGKSFSMKMMIKAMDDNNLTYTLCTPTGTSAKVLSNYVNRTASTLHKRILKYGQINSDVLIVDESSFLDITTMNMIINNISEHTKVIFVFDNAQLPSVGIGAITKDLIDFGKIPTTELTKVFRYGEGNLDTVVTDIRNGKPYVDYNGEPLYKQNKKDKSYNFVLIDDDDPIEQIINEYDKLLKKYKKEDILILCPYNIGEIGVYNICNKIQDKYNPLLPNMEEVSIKKGDTEIKFRKNDRILNCKNIYDMLSYEDYISLKNDRETQVDDYKGGKNQIDLTNGQFGTVLNIDDGNLIAQFDEDVVVYLKKDLKHLLLGSVCSIHKSQGNQALAVILVTHKSHIKNLHRSLLYVGSSRSREMLIEIGEPRIIEKALDRIVINERDTWLLELLDERRVNNGKF